MSSQLHLSLRSFPARSAIPLLSLRGDVVAVAISATSLPRFSQSPFPRCQGIQSVLAGTLRSNSYVSKSRPDPHNFFRSKATCLQAKLYCRDFIHQRWSVFSQRRVFNEVCLQRSMSPVCHRQTCLHSFIYLYVLFPHVVPFPSCHCEAT